MARPGQRKPAVGERLSDYVAIGVLPRTFPPDLVDRVIDPTGKREQRVRMLPARMTVYLVLALCLFARESYTPGRSAARQRADLGEDLGAGVLTDPSDTALVNAWRRLGPEPLQALFAQVAKPMATPDTQGAWYRGWRLVAFDGTTLDVPDTLENEERVRAAGKQRRRSCRIPPSAGGRAGGVGMPRGGVDCV